MNNYQDFVQAVQAMEADFEKFYDKGVKASGPRIRKQLQAIAKMCKDGRNQVTEVTKARIAEKAASE